VSPLDRQARDPWGRAVIPFALIEIVASLGLLYYLGYIRESRFLWLSWLLWAALSTLVVALAAIISYRITSDGNDRPER
jgi:hypothetical protein